MGSGINLIEEIKALIIETLDLEDLGPQDIEPDAQLFGGGMGLDSIDALELGVALQKRYGLKIDATADDVRSSFYSVASLADFVAARRAS
jgi:acyl carrier protein